MDGTGKVDAPVVIVGGGPVGITLALEIALHGIRSIIVERRAPGESWQARTNLTNTRSMELFRRWGIADSLRENDPVSDEVPRSCTWVTALNGHVIHDFERIFDFDRMPIAAETPEWAPNAGIERTVAAAAAANPLVDLRYGAEYTGFEQDDDGVTVAYTDADGAERRLRCSYMVGADGSRSAVRGDLGVRMQGEADVVQASIWLIEAPGLMDRASVGPSSFYFFINEYRDSLLLARQDDEDRYTLGIVPASAEMDPDSWEDAKRIFLRNVGFEQPVRNLGGGRVRIHSLIAPRFDHGRVLLAGDAAHLISPMGGFGMNIGISDSVDLGWKLAAVIGGWGGPRLLPSYGEERTYADLWIQQECIDNTGLLAPQLVEDGISAAGPDGEAVRQRVGARVHAAKIKEFNSIGAQLGYRYDESPVVVDDGSPRPPVSMGEYVPCARPGARAPHVWLEDGSSLYDHLGTGFALLKLDPAADAAPLAAAAAARAVPLTVFAPPVPGLADLYEAKLALIRPDHHVAWRGDAPPADPATVIDTVRGA
jgi:2-polyprenyl-6-methoxyphenol hydroxylase-like FAD-dependent oxidoreductase